VRAAASAGLSGIVIIRAAARRRQQLAPKQRSDKLARVFVGAVGGFMEPRNESFRKPDCHTSGQRGGFHVGRMIFEATAQRK
jgi:hypothetical protein